MTAVLLERIFAVTWPTRSIASLGFVTAVAVVAVLALVLRDWWLLVAFLTSGSVGVLSWSVGLKANSSRVRVTAAAVGAGALSIPVVGALLVMQTSLVMILAAVVAVFLAVVTVCRAYPVSANVCYETGTRRLSPGFQVLPGVLGLTVVVVFAAGAVAIAVIAARMPVLVLTAILGFCVLLVAWWRAAPKWDARTYGASFLALAVAAVPFRGLAEVKVGSIAIGLSDAFLAVALAIYIFGRYRRTEMRVPPYAFGLLFFSAWLAVTTVVATEPALVLKETLKWTQCAIALVVLSVHLRENTFWRFLLWAVGVAVVGQAVLGIAQTVGGIGPPGLVVDNVIRAFGTFQQPNPYGGYLGIHLPILLAAAIYARGTRRRWILLIWLLVLVAVGASRSRGAWLGFGASSLAVIFAAGYRSLTWTRVILSLAGIAVLALIVATLAGVFDRSVPTDIEQVVLGGHPVADVVRDRAMENYAIVERVAHWSTGWRMFLDHPVLGVGGGNFDEAYRRYALHPFDAPLGHAHNVFLNFGAEAGFGGMLIFGALILWAFGYAVTAVRRVRGTDREWVVVAALGGLVALTTHNLVDNLFVSGMGIVFALLVAVCVTCGNGEGAMRRSGRAL